MAVGSRTDSTFAAPAGVADGDWLLLIMGVGAASGPPAVSLAGFSPLTGFPGNINQPDPFTVDLVAMAKKASGESGSYTFTHAAATTNGVLYCISGADEAGPFAPSPTIANGTGASTTATGLTATGNALVIFAGISWDGWHASAPTGPTGSTPTFSLRYTGGVSGSFACWDGVLAAPAATGNKTATCLSGSGKPWCVSLIAVNPPAGPAVPVPTAGASLDGGCPVDWDWPLNSGLVGWWAGWPLPGWSGGPVLRDAVRHSGRRGYNGTLTNGPTWGPGPRPGLRGLVFDGSDDHVDLGTDAASLRGTGPGVVSAWVKTTSTSPGGVITAYNSAPPFQGWGLGVGMVTAGRIGYWSNNTGAWRESTASVNDGAWHWIAAAFGDTTVALYADGVLINSNSWAAPSVDNIGVHIGQSNTNANRFNGSIADVQVRFLPARPSDGYVAQLYRQSRLGHPDALRWVRARAPARLGGESAGGNRRRRVIVCGGR